MAATSFIVKIRFDGEEFDRIATQLKEHMRDVPSDRHGSYLRLMLQIEVVADREGFVATPRLRFPGLFGPRII